MSASEPAQTDADLVEIARGGPVASVYAKRDKPGEAFRFYLRVFAPFALGHFISYILRSINSVLAPWLVADLSLDAAQIGLLTSAYFFAFAAAQLPVGVALDRYGPRRVQAVLLPVAAVGCVWFSLAHDFVGLVCARMVTGVGLSACFMSSLKAVSQWRPASRMPSMNGYFLAVGGLGAMASTAPVQWATKAIGWRGVFFVLAATLVFALILIVFVTPEKREGDRGDKATSFRSVIEIYRQRRFRRTISVALAPHAAYLAVQGLWLGAWLDQSLHLPHRTAGLYLLYGMAAMVLGTVVVGKFAEAVRKIGFETLDVAACGLWIFAVVQAFLIWKGPAFALMIAIAYPFFGAFAGLEFAIVAQSAEPGQAGRASTCLNLLVFAGSFIFQAGFGAALGAYQKFAHGASIEAAYRFAFALLLLVQAPGLIAWALRKGANLLIGGKTG